VIFLPGGGVIIVNPPFGGETGGTVIPLGEARKLYNSHCLYGPGPRYAIVGTNRADHIHGTKHAERILGLGGNDHIVGGGGSDCIDGGRGNDYLQNKDGNTRFYGGLGNDRIFARNGNDHIWAGNGRNRVSAGRGNDWVYGGPGITTVYMDNGPKHVFLGARGGKALAPGARDAISCASKKDVVYVNIFALGYAKRHGCKILHPLTPARL
jgi:Ca2+-binding RTX toxin-like protein